MKILQVSYCDLLGSRFNGHDLNEYYRSYGHDAKQFVWIKQGDSDDTLVIAEWLHKIRIKGQPYSLRDYLNKAVAITEEKKSVQSLYYPWPAQFFFDSRFTDRDIVHYHLIHNGYFSLRFLPRLAAKKPSVWTIHDPWAMGGHCVYPYDCERWKSGCGDCPDLNTFMSMKSDNTRAMHAEKERIVRQSDIDIVVASKYMYNLINDSSIFEGKRIHHIPFGVNFDVFKIKDQKQLRLKYGIPLDNLVISFRQTNYEYKGLTYIKEALGKLSERDYADRITLITVNETGLLNEFRDKFQLVEFGIVTDEGIMSDVYNCADIFLMPSTAEAFGMMAVEAMSCGKPVIVFEGTSLPDVTFAPHSGISVPMRDSEALSQAIHYLLTNEAERNARSAEAYRLSRLHYNFNDHAQHILTLYQDVIARRKYNENH